MPSGLREGHKSTGFLRKRECRWLLPWRGNGRAELGWRRAVEGSCPFVGSWAWKWVLKFCCERKKQLGCSYTARSSVCVALNDYSLSFGETRGISKASMFAACATSFFILVYMINIYDLYPKTMKSISFLHTRFKDAPGYPVTLSLVYCLYVFFKTKPFIDFAVEVCFEKKKIIYFEQTKNTLFGKTLISALCSLNVSISKQNIPHTKFVMTYNLFIIFGCSMSNHITIGLFPHSAWYLMEKLDWF